MQVSSFINPHKKPSIQEEAYRQYKIYIYRFYIPVFPIFEQTNISEAIAESDIIFVVVPAYSMNTIASMCAPHLRDGQIVVLTPANFGGSLYFHNVMKQQGCTAQVTLAEFSCMMYACRKKSPSSVWVRGYKHNMGVACFPAAHTDEVVAKLKVLYPYLIKYNNILEQELNALENGAFS